MILTACLALVGVVVAAIALRLYLDRAAELRLRADEIVDFAARASVGRENVFAMCPPGYCKPPADQESPVFAMDWQHLRTLWEEVAAMAPRVVRVAEAQDGRRLVYIQRSWLLRFPDIVTVEFIPLDGGRATLAVDSRSRYGRSDLGVNRQRILAWISAVEQLAGQKTRATE
jgi:uncharacterized protein (DUF1499 family)